MTTRRNLFLAALVLFSGALGAAQHAKSPLEVTYYYMPG